MKVSFDVKGDFNNTLNWLKDVTNRHPSTVLSKIAEDGVKSLAANTPEDTGETASGWVGKISDKGIVWLNTAHPESEANMAKLIELGHATRTGGYVQPRPYIKRAMAPVWATVDERIKELIK